MTTATRGKSPPNAARAGGNIWLQRSVGMALGALAGAAAAYAPDIWQSLSPERRLGQPGDRLEAHRQEPATPIPPPDAAEIASQIAHTLVVRARDLIVRGQIRDAEKFVAAAEKLDPESEPLAETRRLLVIAKAKIELAEKAPAAGDAQAERKSGEHGQDEPKPTAPKAQAEPERLPAPENKGAKERSASGQTLDAELSAAFAAGVENFRAKNYQEAFAAFQRAAEAGYAPAQNYIGYMHRHGLGTGRDYDRALEWYRKAAAQGHPGAVNNIGYMYRQGLGVERDDAKARDYFRQAAERGDTAARFNFGQMLAEGAGTAGDYREALKWYTSAAEKGHARAAMGLAHLYAQGLGAAPDPAEAYFWYSVAGRAGIEGADRLRRAMGSRLTAAQRQAADARFANWKRQHADSERQ